MYLKSLMVIKLGQKHAIVVNTVAADGQAPLGARPSAGTVVTLFGPCIYSTSKYTD